MLKRSLLLIVLAIAALFAVACEDAPEEGMAIFGVSDINGGDPVTSIGGVGATVDMTFRWRPYFDVDGSITEAYPHGDYVVDHYRVTWTSVTAGATPISPREEETNIFVPVYELVSAGIRVVTPAEAAGVAAGTVMNAHIDFTAHEMGTAKEAKFAVSFTVNFN
jgi:hypothetical protein